MFGDECSVGFEYYLQIFITCSIRKHAANPISTLLILQIIPHTEPPPTLLVEEKFCVNSWMTWAQLVAQVNSCLGLRRWD